MEINSEVRNRRQNYK
jgi:serine/threonine protein kinase